MNNQNVPFTASESSQIPKIVIAMTWDLNLSRRGQIELATFPTSVLSIAYSAYKKKVDKSGDMATPFYYVLSVCQKQCDQQKLAQDTKLLEYLLQTENLNKNDTFTIKDFFAHYADQSDYTVDPSEYSNSQGTHKGKEQGARYKPYEAPTERHHLPQELEKVARHFFKYQYFIMQQAIDEGKTYLLPWVSLSHRIQESDEDSNKMFDAKRKQRLIKQEIDLYEANERIKKDYIHRGILEEKTMSLNEIRQKIHEATTPPKHKTEEEILETEYIPPSANWLSFSGALKKTFEQLQAEMSSDEEIFEQRAKLNPRLKEMQQEHGSHTPPKSNEDQFSEKEMGYVNIESRQKKLSS